MEKEKMKFISLKGYVDDYKGNATSYIGVEIENGLAGDSIGDQVWIHSNGREMEIYDGIEEEDYREIEMLFANKRAFRGAMMRMGIQF